MALAKNIRYLRKKMGYSQDDVAEKLGYKSYTTIQKWEMGTSEPPLNKLKELAVLFNVNMNDLANSDLEHSRIEKNTFTNKDEKDIAKRLDTMLEDLENNQQALMFNGEALDETTEELLKASLENSLRVAKINAKEKFTPKKYRNNKDK